MTDQPTPPPERQHGETLLKALVLVMVLLGVAVMYLNLQIAAARTATYESRSVGCRLLLGHGVKIPQDDPCNDPRVLRYYDPRGIVAGATTKDALTNRRLTCRVLRHLGEADTACSAL